jgi:hypothetical protein
MIAATIGSCCAKAGIIKDWTASTSVKKAKDKRMGSDLNLKY